MERIDQYVDAEDAVSSVICLGVSRQTVSRWIQNGVNGVCLKAIGRIPGRQLGKTTPKLVLEFIYEANHLQTPYELLEFAYERGHDREYPLYNLWHAVNSALGYFPNCSTLSRWRKTGYNGVTLKFLEVGKFFFVSKREFLKFEHEARCKRIVSDKGPSRLWPHYEPCYKCRLPIRKPTRM